MPEGLNQGFMVDGGRLTKARKIEAVLQAHLGEQITSKKILDIGCGNGQILEYFSARNETFGCDLNNQLADAVSDHIQFRKIDSTALPYPDAHFDIVITNHVIEHVDDQLNHLREIFRVLKPEGVCYFSTPNRNFPVEPHYKIPLIHYLPTAAFIWLLKILGRYHENLRLLTHRQMLAIAKLAGFQPHEYTARILKYPEQYCWDGASLRGWPMWAVWFLQGISQTNIFVLRKQVSI